MFPRAGTFGLATVTCAHLRGVSRQELRTLCWLLCPQGFFLFFFNTWRWQEVSAGALDLPSVLLLLSLLLLLLLLLLLSKSFYQNKLTPSQSEDRSKEIAKGFYAFIPILLLLLLCFIFLWRSPLKRATFSWIARVAQNLGCQLLNWEIRQRKAGHFLDVIVPSNRQARVSTPTHTQPQSQIILVATLHDIPRTTKDACSNHRLLECKFVMPDSRGNNDGKEAATDSPPKERSAQETRGGQCHPTWRHWAPRSSVRGRKCNWIRRTRKRARTTNPPTRAVRIAPRRERRREQRFQRHFPAKWVRASGRW